jgi:hypothetical protein
MIGILLDDVPMRSYITSTFMVSTIEDFWHFEIGGGAARLYRKTVHQLNYALSNRSFRQKTYRGGRT